MRAVRLNTKATGLRLRSASRGSRPGRGRAGPPRRLRGLRWVPVPLAALAAVIGVLVMGSFQGQEAAANANLPGYHAGGLSLNVVTMLWLSNDMTGQGPLHVPKGIPMDPGMMPGMQQPGTDRLRVEVNLTDDTSSGQTYSLSDFTLATPRGQTFSVDGSDHADMPRSSDVYPGFRVTVNLYFDMPAKQHNHLTLKWSHGGTTVSIPVTTGGAQPGPMHR